MDKYNRILVEFEFLIDLDVAIFKFIRAEYNNLKFVDQDIIKINNEDEIIKLMINRQHINPLEIILPNVDSTNLYDDIINNHMNELLKYAKASDIFPLMVTFLKEATSVDITVLCNSKLQEDFIKSLNNKLPDKYDCTLIKTYRINDIYKSMLQKKACKLLFTGL